MRSMSTIRISLVTNPAQEPAPVDLPAIPRVGDHLKLSRDSTYEVTRVVWDIPSGIDDLINMSNILVFLKPALAS
jgi:hypothetical protein